MHGKKYITAREIDLGLAVISAASKDPRSAIETPVGGFTFDELADMIGCSETALRRTAAQALLKIRNKHPELIKELTNS